MFPGDECQRLDDTDPEFVNTFDDDDDDWGLDRDDDDDEDDDDDSDDWGV